MIKTRSTISALLLLAAGGCHQATVRQADRDVYQLLQDRQQAALGVATDVRIDDDLDEPAADARMYEFNPRPVDDALPASFATARDLPAESESNSRADDDGQATTTTAQAQQADLTADIFTPEEMDRVSTFTLRDTFTYAARHSRDLQSAKEELYLAALDLTLERHLWTPQFVAEVTAGVDFSDAGGVDDEERAFTATSDLGVTQQLPYGGRVVARVVSTLVRDLKGRVADSESSSVILEADLPLLRGAGHAAYESRYSAERDMIYAVRLYERFRRSFLVNVAARYFALQGNKAAIANTFVSYQSRFRDWEKADFTGRVGQSRDVFEAPRAKSILRSAEAGLVNTKESYESALDQFKIFLGMPVDFLLDVVDQELDKQSQSLDVLLPEVDGAEAERVALRLRLDLLTDADRIDDAGRGISVAKNRILPDLDFNASAAFHSDPEHLNAFDVNVERNDYSALLQLRMDDRKTERNAYRASLIAYRRAQRQHEETVDSVRADVRRAIRRIEQQSALREIQTLNVHENELRLEAARAQFDLGKSTNQDVVDAESDLLRARNDLARAVAEYRNAILEFRRDTGTLRVSDDGLISSLGTLLPKANPTGPADPGS